jgi:hypothetical protein
LFSEGFSQAHLLLQRIAALATSGDGSLIFSSSSTSLLNAAVALGSILAFFTGMFLYFDGIFKSYIVLYTLKNIKMKKLLRKACYAEKESTDLNKAVQSKLAL